MFVYTYSLKHTYTVQGLKSSRLAHCTLPRWVRDAQTFNFYTLKSLTWPWKLHQVVTILLNYLLLNLLHDFNRAASGCHNHVKNCSHSVQCAPLLPTANIYRQWDCKNSNTFHQMLHSTCKYHGEVSLLLELQNLSTKLDTPRKANDIATTLHGRLRYTPKTALYGIYEDGKLCAIPCPALSYWRSCATRNDTDTI